MGSTTLESRDGVAVADGSVADLEKAFHGSLIRPSDAGYDAARRIWNGMHRQKTGADRPVCRRARTWWRR